jgi:putative YphP/YqiW family bacilliredoxin
MYDPAMTQPMEEELTDVGVKALKTPKEVDTFFADKTGTALVVVNSVCGCAAGGARPGVREALRHKVKPNRIATVFAGVDREAVQQARSHFADFPPSSPCLILLKGGEVVDFIPRHQIEGRDARTVALQLTKAFDKHCTSSAQAKS